MIRKLISFFSLGSALFIAREAWALPSGSPESASSNTNSSTDTPLGAFATIYGPYRVSGNFRFSYSDASLTAIKVQISMTGLLAYNKQDGFAYYIHQMPVGADYNCANTLAHFNPPDPVTGATCNKPACDISDLAGRHGNLPGIVDQFTLNYVDRVISFTGPNSIIGKSIVIYGPGMSKIACGNIVPWTPPASRPSR